MKFKAKISDCGELQAVARELFLDRGGQNRERQIDGIFIEFGSRFCPRNKRSL